MAEDFDIEALLEAPYNTIVDKPATASIDHNREQSESSSDSEQSESSSDSEQSDSESNLKICTDREQSDSSSDTSSDRKSCADTSSDRKICAESERSDSPSGPKTCTDIESDNETEKETRSETDDYDSYSSRSSRSRSSSFYSYRSSRSRSSSFCKSRIYSPSYRSRSVGRTYYSPYACLRSRSSSDSRSNSTTSDSSSSRSYSYKTDDASSNNISSPQHSSSNGKKRENGKRRSRSGSRTRDSVRDKDDHREIKRSKDKDREKDKDLHKKASRRSRSKDRRARSKSKDRKRSRSRDKRRRSKDRDRRRDRSRSPRRRSPQRRRSRTPNRRRRSISPRPFRRGRTPPNGLGDRTPNEDLDIEERDARTVFCMQLSQRIRARDLEEFFSSVGKVRDVRLITCNKTKRFKGIAYIEFRDPESVPLAMGLSGQKLLGIPISVQHTQAEKNRLANVAPPPPPKNHVGPMRLYVGSLHFNITEDMLRGIFEPFGKIDSIQLIMDAETGRSKGYGFISFHNADDAKKALEQLNGFELAGRPMKVGNVTERLDVNTNTSLDTDEMDRSGIDLGATGRLQLMFKLAEGAGLAVPQAAANALLASAPQPQSQSQAAQPSIATQCFLLSNMFDPVSETNPSWDIEIRDEVIEECQKHGGILHVYVDKASQGNVYVKCPSIATAVLAVNSLHGRWFAGRVITAAYVPLHNYHALFPDATNAVQLLQSSVKS